MLSWNSNRDDFIQATQIELVEYCASLPTLRGQEASIKRLSTDVVAKIQMNLDAREYENQTTAWRLLNSEELRIPQPFRFFHILDTDGVQFGYFLMEYLSGSSLTQDSLYRKREVVDKVANAIRLLHEAPISHSIIDVVRPGSISGFARGFPWGEGTTDNFKSIQDLENALYSRLEHQRQGGGALRLPDHYLKLCHLDLAPRNIILMDSGNIGIVDWSTMAFYSSIFEAASLAFLRCLADPSEHAFFEHLARQLCPDTVESNAIVAMLQRVHVNSFHYAL